MSNRNKTPVLGPEALLATRMPYLLLKGCGDDNVAGAMTGSGPDVLAGSSESVSVGFSSFLKRLVLLMILLLLNFFTYTYNTGAFSRRLCGARMEPTARNVLSDRMLSSQERGAWYGRTICFIVSAALHVDVITRICVRAKVLRAGVLVLPAQSTSCDNNMTNLDWRWQKLCSRDRQSLLLDDGKVGRREGP